jgi:hypothetical protein
MAIDPTKLRPSELTRLLNSTAHECLNAETFTPRGLAASTRNRFPYCCTPANRRPNRNPTVLQVQPMIVPVESELHFGSRRNSRIRFPDTCHLP